MWDRYAVRYSIAMIACALGVWMQYQYRVPGSHFFVFVPVIGAALSVLSSVYLISLFLDYWPRWDDARRLLKRIEWSVNWLVRVFVYSSLALFLNGALDSSKPVYRFGEITASHVLSTVYPWVTVRYHDAPASPVNIVLGAGERLWGSDPVCVTLKEGAFGFQVVTKIEKDWDSYGREILRLAPTAAEISKTLIFFDLEHGKTTEGVSAAQEHLKLHPQDYETAYHVGSALFADGKMRESIQFFDHAAARHPTYDMYQSLGTALNWSGQRKRAAEVLEKSIELRPEDWEAYYHLGYVFLDMGKLQDATAWFEKALERRPDFPEVEEIIARLKRK